MNCLHLDKCTVLTFEIFAITKYRDLETTVKVIQGYCLYTSENKGTSRKFSRWGDTLPISATSLSR